MEMILSIAQPLPRKTLMRNHLKSLRKLSIVSRPAQPLIERVSNLRSQDLVLVPLSLKQFQQLSKPLCRIPSRRSRSVELNQRLWMGRGSLSLHPHHRKRPLKIKLTLQTAIEKAHRKALEAEARTERKGGTSIETRMEKIASRTNQALKRQLRSSNGTKKQEKLVRNK